MSAAAAIKEAKAYLGMKIERDREAKTIRLLQSLMTRNLVEKYQMADSKTKSIPMDVNLKLTAGDGEPLDITTAPYSQLVGSMMYLAVCTRPDIAFPVVGALRSTP